MKKNGLRMLINAAIMSALLACGSGGGDSDRAGGDLENAEALAVFVIADRDLAGKQELYKANFNSAAHDIRLTRFTKISAPLIAAGDVLQMKPSPDKQSVAYVADADVDGIYELYVARSDGTGVVKVSGEFQAFSDIQNYFADDDYSSVFFAWSPDSRHLAFSADLEHDEVFALYTVRADGSELTEASADAISADDQFLEDVVWSLDGRYLAFKVSDWVNRGVVSLYIAEPGSGRANHQAITLKDSEDVESFAWSPVENALAFVVRDEDTNQDRLFVTRAADSGWSEPIQLSYEAIDAASISSYCDFCDYANQQNFGDFSFNEDSAGFAWAENGENIFYMSRSYSETSKSIFRVAAEGGQQPVRLLSRDIGIFSESLDFSLSPDGRHLAAFHSLNILDHHTLFMVDPASGDSVAVDTDFEPSWLPNDSAWSPDSRHLAVTYWESWQDGQQESIDTRVLLVNTAGVGEEIRLANSSVIGGDWLNENELFLLEAESNVPGAAKRFLGRFDIASKQRTRLLTIDRDLIAARFSKDRRYLAVLNAANEKTELAIYDLRNRVSSSELLDFRMSYPSTGDFTALAF